MREPRTEVSRVRRAAFCFAGALVTLSLSAGPAPAQTPVPKRPAKIALVTQVPEERGRGRALIRVDPHAWEQLFHAGSARVVDFPLPGGRRVELEVSSFDVLERGARFFVGGPDGLTETAAPAMRFFRGQVPGDGDSLVSLNLFD